MAAKVYKHLCFATVNPRYMLRFVSMMLATKMKVCDDWGITGPFKFVRLFLKSF
jgi:hypothetical protein